MRSTRRIVLLAVAVMLLPLAVAVAKPTPAQKCVAAKNKSSGTHQLCVGKAVGKSLKSGNPLDLSKCAANFTGAWDKAETNGGGECPDAISDTAVLGSYLTARAAEASSIIAGTTQVPLCGDGVVNAIGEHCDGADLNGTTCTSLSYSSGALACNGSCKFDTAGCVE